MWSRYLFRRCASTGKLAFGKHNGKTYDEVIRNHPDYVQWIKKQTDLTPTMQEFLDYAQSSAAPSTSFRPRSGIMKKFEKKPSKGNNGAPPKNREKIPISGASIVGFGSHEGRTFAEVFERKKWYCKWLVEEMCDESSSKPILLFIIYCQQRWLQPCTDSMGISFIEAQKDCLKGQRYALAGNGLGIYSRSRVESCLTFFGAKIAKAVSSKCSGLVIISQETSDGRKIEDSSKYADAVRLNTTIVPLDEFLGSLHKPGNATVRFNLHETPM